MNLIAQLSDLKHLSQNEYITTDFSKHELILQFNEDLERCILRKYTDESCFNTNEVCGIALSFEPRIAKILGFEPDKQYSIFSG